MANTTNEPVFEQFAHHSLCSAFEIEIVTVQVVVVTVSIFLNFTVLVITVCNTQLHKVSSVFVASLALSELIFAIVTDAVSLIFLDACRKGKFYISESCFQMYVISLTFICSLLHHLMISAERWLYIARPFLHQRLISRESTACSLCLVWLLAVVSCVSLVTGNCETALNEENIKVHLSLLLPSVHFVLSVCMFLGYGHICVITRRQIKAIRLSTVRCERNDSDQILENLKTTWRQVRMLVIVFGTYFVVVMPFASASIYIFVNHVGLLFYSSLVGRIIQFIAITQCFINFFTYSIQDREFRRALKRCLIKIRFVFAFKRIHPVDSAM